VFDRGEDPVVARGTALFFDGCERYVVRTGALMFVPAQREHRFEEFSADFAVWVMFYGPEGGEAADQVSHAESGD
jgi:mannose-6-phosphate isomerase-like protein (cupin superfamily)